MPIQANDFQTLHDYAQGFMSRAMHHAENVSAIALALLGGVIWRAKPGTVEIKQYDGKLANVLWWESLNGNRYACRYNHEKKEIEILNRNLGGTAIHSFSNSTPITDVVQIFATL
jgi:hypothetical protein